MLLHITRRTKGILIEEFEGEEDHNKKAHGIATLLRAELYRLIRLYQTGEQENHSRRLAYVPLRDMEISAGSYTRQEESQELKISYSGTKFEFPFKILRRLFVRAKVRVSGKIIDEEGKRVLVCYVKGIGQDRVIRINSHYGLHEQKINSDQPPIAEQIEHLAAEIMSLFSASEEKIPTRALQSYNEGIRAYQDALNRHSKRNLLLIDAERHFRSALRDYENFYHAKCSLAMVYHSLNLNEYALNLLKSIVTENPENIQAHISLAHIRLTKTIENAEEYYINPINRLPPEIIDDCNEIESICKRINQLDSSNAYGHFLRSNLYFIWLKHKLSLKYARETLKLAEKQNDKFLMTDALQTIALTHSKMIENKKEDVGKISFSYHALQAKKFIKKAIAVNPNNFATHYYFGRIYLRLGQPEKAEKFFIETLTFEPDNLDIWGNILECQILKECRNEELYVVSVSNLKKRPGAISHPVLFRLKENIPEKKEDLKWIKVLWEFSRGLEEKFSEYSENPQVLDEIKKKQTLIPLEDWKNGQICALQGRLFLNEECYENAHNCFGQAIKLLEKYPEEINSLKLHSLQLLACTLNRNFSEKTDNEESTYKKKGIVDDDPLNTYFFEAEAELHYSKGEYQLAYNNFIEAICTHKENWKPLKIWKVKESVYSLRVERLFIRAGASKVRLAENEKNKRLAQEHLKYAFEALDYSSGLFSFRWIVDKHNYKIASNFWLGRAFLASGDYQNAAEYFGSADEGKDCFLAKYYRGLTYRKNRDIPKAYSLFENTYTNIKDKVYKRLEYDYLDMDWTSKKLCLFTRLTQLAVLSYTDPESVDLGNDDLLPVPPECGQEYKSDIDLYRRTCSGIVFYHKNQNKKAIMMLRSVLCHSYDLEAFEHLQMALIAEIENKRTSDNNDKMIAEAFSLCDQVEEIDIKGDVANRMRRRMNAFERKYSI
ncbi:hypothetical protein CHISP_0074 [Chitinispirillum alkaliphilum]|nr:hypothetical protein CHISP_0074 [Chitinispirillum alkaliphilum]